MEDLLVDKQIYRKEVLLKTAYAFTNRAYIHLSQDEYHWIVCVTPKDDTDINMEEFENELIQQELRTELNETNAEIRKLMLARAYASTIVDVQGSACDNPGSEPNDISSQLSEKATVFDDTADILKGWFEQSEN